MAATGDRKLLQFAVALCLETEDLLLYRELQKLPEKYRQVIHLFYYEEMSVAQIADLLHRKESTIRTQLTRARAMLKEVLGDDYAI